MAPSARDNLRTGGGVNQPGNPASPGSCERGARPASALWRRSILAVPGEGGGGRVEGREGRRHRFLAFQFMGSRDVKVNDSVFSYHPRHKVHKVWNDNRQSRTPKFSQKVLVGK